MRTNADTAFKRHIRSFSPPPPPPAITLHPPSSSEHFQAQYSVFGVQGVPAPPTVTKSRIAFSFPSAIPFTLITSSTLS